MDIGKADLLLQYILTIASEEDEFTDRSLGPIHLLKYVYLADLEYAGRNEGVTYTGAEWKFHHFGPWSPSIYNRIEYALKGIGAERKVITSNYEDDTVRWSLSGIDKNNILTTLEKKIDSVSKQAIKKYVHKFTSNTESLLHYVYQTRPMLTAAPGEIITFHSEKAVQSSDAVIKEEKLLSNKQLKGLKMLREKIQQKMKSKLMNNEVIVERDIISPRYDETFFQGQEWLDSLAGKPIEVTQGELKISPDIWKSKSRFDDEIS